MSTLDPVALGYIERGAPMDYLGTRESHCPRDGVTTTQEGFRTMASAWFGLGLPFGRKSTRGKLGAKADLWICLNCKQLVP
jgi:hypothetical protein